MNKKIYNIINLSTFVATLCILASCSSSVPQKEIGEVQTEVVYEENFRINVKKAFCWVNAMPGPEKPRFHVSGEVEILDNSNYDFEKMSISKVTVLQTEKLVFIFTPQVIEKIENNKNTLTFSTIRGLLLNAALNQKKPVDLLILFNDGSDDIEYKIENVPIELAL